ncbi:hypothetical protein HPB47_023105 [Ixodes persulcatus]|uniref:Uncharacterized protein n=1 Tax=Ixodes persulcatus TaxID=34615 RepID=A0AC60Q7T8_IXOPE|nr:hypothetical protein HPB47_023105 [Ixodes persulcatus]
MEAWGLDDYMDSTRPPDSPVITSPPEDIDFPALEVTEDSPAELGLVGNTGFALPPPLLLLSHSNSFAPLATLENAQQSEGKSDDLLTASCIVVLHLRGKNGRVAQFRPLQPQSGPRKPGRPLARYRPLPLGECTAKTPPTIKIDTTISPKHALEHWDALLMHLHKRPTATPVGDRLLPATAKRIRPPPPSSTKALKP